MLTAAIGIDRPVEADVWRPVAGQDRLGPFDGNGGAAPRDSIERLDLVQPIALDQPLGQVEARRHCIARGTAPGERLDRHCPSIAHLKNRTRTTSIRNISDYGASSLRVTFRSWRRKAFCPAKRLLLLGPVWRKSNNAPSRRISVGSGGPRLRAGPASCSATDQRLTGKLGQRCCASSVRVVVGRPSKP